MTLQIGRILKTSAQMPINMQFSFLDSHYGSRTTLITGCIGQIGACALCLLTTGDMNFVAFAVIHTVIVALRLADMFLYDRATTTRTAPATAEFLRHWDRRYSVGVYVGAGALGMMAGYALFFYPISLAAVITVGLACGSLISVVGRNFGKISNINILTLACGMPMCCALMVRGLMWGTEDLWLMPRVAPFARDVIDPRILLAMTAVLLAPLMQIARTLALNVRTLLHHSYTSTEALNYSKQLLHIALDNMPSGLIMLGDDSRIQLVNLKVERYLGLTSNSVAGRSIFSILRSGSEQHRYSERRARDLVAQLKRLIVALDHNDTPSDLFHFRDGEVIEIKAYRTVRSVMEAVGVGNSKPKPFLNEETKGVVFILEDVSERISARNKIEHLGRYDSLSALPNRNFFTEVIEDAVARMADGSFVALAMFDVDSFKKYNDTLGHAAGDQIIVQIAAKMKRISDPRIILCRTGGDEFVVAFHGMTERDNVTKLFDSVFSSICTNYVIQGRSLAIKVSGGVAVMKKSEFDLDETLKRADFALYETKLETKSGSPRDWQMFSKEMAVARERVAQSHEDLRKAVREEAFTISYQAMRTPDRRRIVSAEALARWIHPTRGMVPPSEFIKTAEEIGAISDITRIILKKACLEAATWTDDVTVSVNLSAVDLSRPDILKVVRNALDLSGLAPHRLQVEVTETVFVADIEMARSILSALRTLGVKTALDDFGTGYSSLSLLSHLPLDKVKIDKSFIANIGIDEKADTIFGATVQLARVAGFDVVVEGVERQDQLDAINRICDVDLVQGYLFGRPASSGSIKTQIARAKQDGGLKVIERPAPKRGSAR